MAKHNELGHLGEEYAVKYLMSIGYNIIETDWQFEHKDLDIIAYDQEENMLVIVEVKTRSRNDYGEPLEAIDYKKMQNLVKCANIYIKQRNYHGNCRFDVISLVGKSAPFALTHIKDAFNAASAY